MAILTLRKNKIAAALAAIFLFFGTPVARADDTQPLQLFEEKIKSGLIYNFLKYTEWPAARMSSENPLRICLVGNAPFDQFLSPLRDRTAQQHGIRIQRIESSAAQNCDLLLIHRNESAKTAGLLASVKSRPVLTISDISGFADSGGMVEFRTQDNHVGFIVNRKAVADAGIRIEDRLLKLAWSDTGPIE
ncbi:MAG TPA: YfiR family protein [Patescibacteria group bacterium]|jgi:hypothetical protein|nr:YfiR family protein [Patescibacteria group bacterium]